MTPPRFELELDGTKAGVVAVAAHRPLGTRREEPIAFTRGSPSFSGIEFLPLGRNQDVVLTRDFRRFVVTEVTRGEEAPRWETPVRLGRGWRLVLGRNCELAWTDVEPRTNGDPRLWLRHLDGPRSLAVDPQELLWADVDDAGKLVALGLTEQTVLLPQPEGRPKFFPPALAGHLSPGGDWLVLEREQHEGFKLEIVNIASGRSLSNHSKRLAERVVFDEHSRRVACVALDSVRVFRLDGNALLLHSLAPGQDAEWRNAAFTEDGTLALGGMREIRHAFRADRDGRGAQAASAVAFVERYGAELHEVEHVETKVRDWNASSPELVPVGERLHALVWPSLYSIER